LNRRRRLQDVIHDGGDDVAAAVTFGPGTYVSDRKAG
jgi:hypothetical protein